MVFNTDINRLAHSTHTISLSCNNLIKEQNPQVIILPNQPIDSDPEVAGVLRRTVYNNCLTGPTRHHLISVPQGKPRSPALRYKASKNLELPLKGKLI